MLLATTAATAPAGGEPASDPPKPLVVHFGSACCGPDTAAATRLDAVPLPKNVTQRRRAWGKEGEFDQCFDLSALDAAGRSAFLAQVRQAVVGGKFVTVDPAGVCNGRP